MLGRGRREDSRVVTANDVGHGAAQDVCGRLIGHQIDALWVFDEDGVAGAFHHRAQELLVLAQGGFGFDAFRYINGQPDDCGSAAGVDPLAVHFQLNE